MSEVSIATVKKFDFDFLWFLILHHSHSPKMCFRKMCVCVCVYDRRRSTDLILQAFRQFTYVTAHSPTSLSLLLRHLLFTYVTWRAAHGLQYIFVFRCSGAKFPTNDKTNRILEIYTNTQTSSHFSLIHSVKMWRIIYHLYSPRPYNCGWKFHGVTAEFWTNSKTNLFLLKSQLLSDKGRGWGMRCDEGLWKARNLADHACRTETGADEMKEMNKMSMDKWWNGICGRGKRKKLRKNRPRLRFE